MKSHDHAARGAMQRALNKHIGAALCERGLGALPWLINGLLLVQLLSRPGDVTPARAATTAGMMLLVVVLSRQLQLLARARRLRCEAGIARLLSRPPGAATLLELKRRGRYAAFELSPQLRRIMQESLREHESQLEQRRRRRGELRAATR